MNSMNTLERQHAACGFVSSCAFGMLTEKKKRRPHGADPVTNTPTSTNRTRTHIFIRGHRCRAELVHKAAPRPRSWSDACEPAPWSIRAPCSARRARKRRTLLTHVPRSTRNPKSLRRRARQRQIAPVARDWVGVSLKVVECRP